MTFYGVLTAAGATAQTGANGDAVALPLRPGPGIFASVLLGVAPFQHRVVIRLSGQTGNGKLDPGERLPVGSAVEIGPDFNFDGTADWGLNWDATLVDSRPGVTSIQSFNDPNRGGYVQVVYTALDPVHGSVKALYSSRLNLFKDAAGNYIEAGVEAPVQVIRVGEAAQGLTLTDLSVNDPVNNDNVVAFWAAAGSTQAIITATPDFTDQVNSRPRFDPDSPLVEYVVAGVHGNAARQAINQIVLHATGGTEHGSLLTLTAGATPGIHYLISREGRVTQIIPESQTANHAPPANASSIGIEMVDDFTGATGTGHIQNANWSPPVQQSKVALLVRDIGRRRPGIPLTHLTTSTMPGPFEMTVPMQAGHTPSRSGIGTGTAGILAHGQVLNRTAGRTDPQNFPSGALSPGTSYTWGAFMSRVNNGIGLQLNSPANLLVTDPLGRRVGVDPTTGLVLNEIPGASFSGPGTEPETLSISDGIDGAYVIQVVGTSSGTFHLDVFAAGADGSLTSTRVAGQTAGGLVTNYTLDHSSQEGDAARLTGAGDLPPAAFDDFAYIDQDTAVVVSVMDNDSDPDGTLDPATLAVTVGSVNGSLTINRATGAIRYQPNPGFYGTETIRYTVGDNGGNVSNEGIVTIFVKKYTLAPVAVDDGATTQQATPVTIDVLNNDFDDDGTIDPTTVAFPEDGDPSHGDVNVDPVSGMITYIPEPGFTGVDSFKYTVLDNDGAMSGESTVTVTVRGGNRSPALTPIGSKTVDELTALTFTAMASDPDVGESLTFSLVAGDGPSGTPIPLGASINLTTGAFTWTPTESQGPGTYSFKVRVTDDGSPALYDEEQITVSVNEVNQPPVLGAIGNRSVDEQTLLKFTVGATDADLPANTLAYSAAGLPPGATFDPATRTFAWIPGEAQGPGSYNVTFTVGDGILSASEMITIRVNEVNAAPVLAPIGNKSVTEGNPLNFIAGASDPDLPANGLTFSLTAGAPVGAAIDPKLGVFTWTPAAAGTFSITVVVTDDGTPALSDSKTFSIVVSSARQTPLITWVPASPITYGTPLGASQLDATATINGVPVPGTFAYALAAGTVLHAGLGQALSLTFTPDDMASYAVAAGSTTVDVLKATPTVTATGARVTYDGKPHPAAATIAAVNGDDLSALLTLGYAPGVAPGAAPLHAGTYTATATFTGTSDYDPTSGSAIVLIDQAAPVLSWLAPAAIIYGTPLGAAQLVAAAAFGGAPLAGSFVYTPAAGTVLHAGLGQPLKAVFTPADTVDFLTAPVATAIDVLKATPVVTVTGARVTYDGKPHPAAATIAAVNGDDLSGLLTVGYAPVPAPNPAPVNAGTYAVTVSFPGTTDYNAVSDTSKQVIIDRATPAFTGLSAPGIVLGTPSTPLSGALSLGALVPSGNVSITVNSVTQNATIGVGGNFSASFSTASLPAGSYTITYSYAGDANFKPVTATTTLAVTYTVSPQFDQDKAHNSGSTIPIKLQLADASGHNVGASSVPIVALYVLDQNGNQVPLINAGGSNPGDVFRYDPTTGTYVFNLKTTGYASGRYTLYFKVANDPVRHSVSFLVG